MPWRIQFAVSVLESALLELPAPLLAKFLHYCERIEKFGPDLGMPHTRAMGRGLFELRLRSADRIVRVFFCIRPGREVVLLHHFIKKTEKTPGRELEIARRRMKEVLDG